jgi:DNA-binding GntR family transcriptional regulator
MRRIGLITKDEGSFTGPEFLSQSIARFLEEKIIERKMKAGTRLIPEKIAKLLKFGKSPIRPRNEAISV